MGIPHPLSTFSLRVISAKKSRRKYNNNNNCCCCSVCKFVYKSCKNIQSVELLGTSVTRMGNLLDFGQLFKPLATIYWPKSPTFLGNSCEGVKIYHISSEIILRQLFWTFGDFLWSHW